MPLLNDDTMEKLKVSGTGFQFSATRIDNLGATEYTLVGIAIDVSGSVAGFGADLEACLQSVIDSCRQSPRADNLMARVLLFNGRVDEIHGFKPLASCNPADYSGVIQPGGGTALYDACVSLLGSMAEYGKRLIAQDYAVNGALYVITDGMDEHSTLRIADVSRALQEALQSESLESLVSILIGINVNNQQVSRSLDMVHRDGGFSQYVETKDASPKTLAKVAGFVSKSISSQSQAVGSNAVSQPVTF